MLSCIVHQILFEVMTHLDNTDNIEKKKTLYTKHPLTNGYLDQDGYNCSQMCVLTISYKGFPSKIITCYIL